MGLLSRLGARAGNFASGARDAMARRADPLNFTDDTFRPLASSVYGAGAGAFGGSMATPDDPLSGALAGAALGAGAGGGLSLARQAGAGVRGGMQRAGALKGVDPMKVADEVMQLFSRNRQEGERYLAAIRQENPALFEEVMVLLR